MTLRGNKQTWKSGYCRKCWQSSFEMPVNCCSTRLTVAYPCVSAYATHEWTSYKALDQSESGTSTAAASSHYGPQVLTVNFCSSHSKTSRRDKTTQLISHRILISVARWRSTTMNWKAKSDSTLVGVNNVSDQPLDTAPILAISLSTARCRPTTMHIDYNSNFVD